MRKHCADCEYMIIKPNGDTYCVKYGKSVLTYDNCHGDGFKKKVKK